MSEPKFVLLLCVIYIRVSMEEQGRGYSLPEQRAACQAKAQQLADELGRQGGVRIELQTVVFEDQMSGELLDRPGLSAARQFVREHHPSHFLCLDPDRLARKTSHLLLVSEELERTGTSLVFVQHDYQATPEGQLFFAMRGAIAEYEKEKIRERTMRGTRGKKKAGLPPPAPIFGYRFNKETDRLDIHESEAQWVRQIYTWFVVDRMTPAAIVDRLNTLGVASRKGTRWYSSTVRAILQNVTYTGTMYTNRYDWTGTTVLRQLPKDRRPAPVTFRERPREDWIPVPVPVVIDRALFEEAQPRFQNLRRHAQRGVGLLSGIARCGLCGGAVHYVTHNDGIYMLRCINRYPLSRESRRPRTQCDLPMVSQHLIERPFWEDLTAAIVNPEHLAARRRRVDNGEADHALIQQARGETQLLEEQLTNLRREQAVVLSQLAKGHVDHLVGEPMLADLKQQIDAAISALQFAQDRLAGLTRTAEAATGFVRHVQSLQSVLAMDRQEFEIMLTTIDLDQRRYVVRQLVREVRIYPGRTFEWDELP